MSVLDVEKLVKQYSSFRLNEVSFSLEQGKITGFIGRNGAGKSTTLKSIFNFVHPDSGEVKFFGLPFCDNEFEIKQQTGLVSGGIDYYPKKKINVITEVTKRFYEQWDDDVYKKYLEKFELDENKTPFELSAGMKVKYSLALALSHNAPLLILDEPTSGLDPVSRDELLDIFLDLCNEGKTILFSTHITSDLDKCADNIIYIKNGSIIAQDNMKHYLKSFSVAEFADGVEPDENIKKLLIGKKRMKDGFSALVRNGSDLPEGLSLRSADLEDIMVHIEREAE